MSFKNRITQLSISSCALLATLSCGKGTTGAEEQTRSSKQASAKASELTNFGLPQGSWGDYSDLLKEIQGAGAITQEGIGTSQGESSHCPNFDVDGNGVIEMADTGRKDENNQPIFKGDGAILARAIANWNLKKSWYLDPSVYTSLSGSGATRVENNTMKNFTSYIICLNNRKSLDLNRDSNLDFGDVLGMQLAFSGLGNSLQRLAGARSLSSLKVTNAGHSNSIDSSQTKVRVAASEQLANDLRICHASFKVNNEAEARTYQVSCAIGSNAVNRALPDLTVTAIRSRASGPVTGCRYSASGWTGLQTTPLNAMVLRNGSYAQVKMCAGVSVD